MPLPCSFNARTRLRRLGWTLLHFLWQGTLLAVAFAAARAALWLSLRLMAGWTGVRRLGRLQLASVDPGMLYRLARLAARLNLKRPIGLVKSTLVEVPTVIGWFRPVILFPASCLTGLSTGQIELILAHELAHIRRGDHWVNLAQLVLETLLLYHPAVWWISRCVREDREFCCDDLAVRVCGNRYAYARALTTLEEQFHQMALHRS